MNHLRNRMYGIDPEIPIRDADWKAVQETLQFDDDDAGRCRYKNPIPRSIDHLAHLPMMLVFIAGACSVIYLNWPVWVMFLFFGGAVFCQAYAGWALARHYVGPLARLELKSRGYDIYVNCGYWLRGLGDKVVNCPECGRVRE